jgi:hypothetical protein
MAQIFHPSFNTLSKASIVAGGVLALAAVGYAALEFNRAPYVTQVQMERDQPVPFSHEHHVGGVGIDCRFCHSTVEESAAAGIPPTKTCMNCHSQVWKEADLLEPVRASYREDKSLEWVRIHDLPDFVYFNHSIHLKKGVGCETCHGRVDKMPLMWRENTLNMEWCLSCHRDPAPNLRPSDALFQMGWREEFEARKRAEHKDDSEIRAELEQLQAELMQQNNVKSLTNCSTCHR